MGSRRTVSSGSLIREEASNLGDGITQQLAHAVTLAAARVHEAWATDNTDHRFALLSEVCTEDVAYANPLNSCSGVQALAELISDLTTAYPGHLPTRTSGIDAHHNAARYSWALRDRAGQTVLGGTEIIQFTPDAMLTSIVSFFGRPPMIRYTYRA